MAATKKVYYYFPDVDSPEIPTSSIELTSTWLAAAGLRLIGGETSNPSRCKPSPPASLVADEATVPRSDFSEVLPFIYIRRIRFFSTYRYIRI